MSRLRFLTRILVKNMTLSIEILMFSWLVDAATTISNFRNRLQIIERILMIEIFRGKTSLVCDFSNWTSKTVWKRPGFVCNGVRKKKTDNFSKPYSFAINSIDRWWWHCSYHNVSYYPTNGCRYQLENLTDRSNSIETRT